MHANCADYINRVYISRCLYTIYLYKSEYFMEFLHGYIDDYFSSILETKIRCEYLQ